MSPLTGVLSEAWDLYRRFAAHFLLIAFVIYVITAVLVALLSLGKIPGAVIGSKATCRAGTGSTCSTCMQMRSAREASEHGDFTPSMT